MSSIYNTQSQIRSPILSQKQRREQFDKLQETVPRFLFRGSFEGSCGGLTLNTPQKVTPHAFQHDDGPVQHLSTRDDPKALIDTHVGYSFDQPTVFTSWTNDWEHALIYAKWHKYTGYITVIDRQSLNRKVDFYYVPDMYDMGLSETEVKHEWLAHAPVEGPGLFCIPVESFQSTGFTQLQTAFAQRRALMPVHLRNVPTHDDIVEAMRFASIILHHDRSEDAPKYYIPSSLPVFWFLVLTHLAILRHTLGLEFDSDFFIVMTATLFRETGTYLPTDFPSAFNRRFEDVRQAERTRRLVLDLIEIYPGVFGGV